MIYDLIKVIYQALSASFGMADKVFSAVGIALVTAVCIMVLISSILRLFTARFIGSQVVLGQERKAASDARKEREAAKRDRAAAEKLRIQSGKEVL